MMYEPEIHPTHLLMNERFANTEQGWQTRNKFIERGYANNTPAFWIVENAQRKGYLNAEWNISPEQVEQVQAYFEQMGMTDATVLRHMLKSDYECGLKLESIARHLHAMLTEERVEA